MNYIEVSKRRSSIMYWAMLSGEKPWNHRRMKRIMRLARAGF